MTDAVIDEIDGRMIRIGDTWLADFASCNYLGFDLDREIIASVPEQLERWGTHPSWSRLLGSPRLYEEIEERLTELTGAEDTLVLPTITLIHMSVIPVLAGSVCVQPSAPHATFWPASNMRESKLSDVANGLSRSQSTVSAGAPTAKSLTTGRMEAPIETESVWTEVPSMKNATLEALHSMR